MKKTVALFRHTKSSWNDPDIPDFERPLSQRGQTAAPLMGCAFKKLEIIPDLILCSTSKRTRQTFEMANLKIENEKVLFDDELYLASEDIILSKILNLPSKVGTVVIIGHNPGLHNLAIHLVGDGKEETINILKSHYPTGGLALIVFDCKKWDEIKNGSGKLIDFVTPKGIDKLSK